MVFLALRPGTFIWLESGPHMACPVLNSPIVTALAFVPITPAGTGIQEFGIVGILDSCIHKPHLRIITATRSHRRIRRFARGLLLLRIWQACRK